MRAAFEALHRQRFGFASPELSVVVETAIAEAIGRLIDDEDLARDLGLRGAEQAARFSWPETARATLRVYRHVAGTR
jgi:glycosyltransferase involved in cell wall biosynthesis